MCGILGLVARVGKDPSLDDAGIARARDLSWRRGPDAGGIWRHENAVLAHRRLAIRDRAEEAGQPMRSADGRYAIVYNGELYNDAELRADLESAGWPPQGWRTGCDTETALVAFQAWGDAAFPRLRGMFAIAVYDTRDRRLTLARDPLGIKPLYLWCDANELAFASEVPSLLALPRVDRRPNLTMVSAYLSTIRTVLGQDTLFEGVHALEPGRLLRCEFDRDALRPEVETFARGPAVRPDDVADDEAAEELRALLRDSVHRHLVSDVPVCTLLSGGVDSAVVAALAKEVSPELRSYCAGADGTDEELADTDLGHAARAARAIGTRHAEARLTRDAFLEEWGEMVDLLGVPLSTPNEVAIRRVAARLREDGCVVTLSGEGADELFAGYVGPLDALHAVTAEHPEPEHGGALQLATTAWVPPADKAALLQPEWWAALEDDRALFAAYQRAFEACHAEAGAHAGPLDVHARFLRRVNLAGLLQRLDTATMLESVEGRTPFADVAVWRFAEALPMHAKYRPAGVAAVVGSGADAATPAAPALPEAARTKLCLRGAARGMVPGTVLERPKASFPLPFQEWMGGIGGRLVESPFLGALVRREALESVAAAPTARWNLAWPLWNLARWGDRWFS